MTGTALLFVPGHEARRRRRARELDTELIVDLEDAVPAGEKAAARRGAVELVGVLPGRCAVRINPLRDDRDAGASGCEDLAAVVVPGLSGIVAPKIDTPDGLREIDVALSEAESAAGLPLASVHLTALVETARGVLGAAEIAAAGLARPLRLGFGAGDLTSDLGVEWSGDESGFDAARAMLPLASRAAGLTRPLDTVFPDLADQQGLRASTRRGKALGYGGKAAIHPDQVEVIREVYQPSDEELERARRVLAAEREAGGGAFALDGRMVDEPVVARARQLLAEASE